MLRKILLGLVVISFFLWIGAMRRPVPPQLDADCERAAFQLSATEVKQSRAVSYTIVGPKGREYALGVNTAEFTGGPGAWRAVPKAGFENDLILAAEPAPMPEGCSRTGLFALPIRTGKHTVTLYELVGRGTVFVAEERIEVTEP